MKPRTHKQRKNCNRGTALKRSEEKQILISFNQFQSRKPLPLILVQLQIVRST